MRQVVTFFFCTLLSLSSFAIDDPWSEDGTGPVVVRSFAHEYLLRAGDSTTVIEPIVQDENGSFMLSFSKDIPLNTNELLFASSMILDSCGFTQHYRVEMLHCNTDSVAHSFERIFDGPSFNACGGREHLVGCYDMRVSILDREFVPIEKVEKADISPWVWIAALLAIGVVILLLRPKKSSPLSYPIGSFLFHENSRLLVRNDEQFELTGKEHQLLLILAKNINDVMTKEELLNRVWQDNGKYEGRTLDVYISRLRKMLEQDPETKLLSIKGIGYKLQVNGPSSGKFTIVLQSITRFFHRQAS